MDRRKFFRSTAIVGTAAILPINAIASVNLDDRKTNEDLYRGLFERVDYEGRNDDVHPAVILAMIAGHNWARQFGIHFEWTPSSRINPETGERLWCVSAYRGGKLIGWSGSWYADEIQDKSSHPYCREWAECNLARRLLGGNFPCDDGDVFSNLSGITVEEIEARLDDVWGEYPNAARYIESK